jgi:hypothetical protein
MYLISALVFSEEECPKYARDHSIHGEATTTTPHMVSQNLN